jgi:hypothetical protein
MARTDPSDAPGGDGAPRPDALWACVHYACSIEEAVATEYSDDEMPVYRRWKPSQATRPSEPPEASISMSQEALSIRPQAIVFEAAAILVAVGAQVLDRLDGSCVSGERRDIGGFEARSRRRRRR